jgi:hypothetical protein
MAILVAITPRRVLKPGGRFLCLEFSHIPPSFAPLGKIYDAYSFAAIPALGQVSEWGDVSALGQGSEWGDVSALGQVSEWGDVSALGQVSEWGDVIALGQVLSKKMENKKRRRIGDGAF